MLSMKYEIIGPTMMVSAEKNEPELVFKGNARNKIKIGYMENTT